MRTSAKSLVRSGILRSVQIRAAQGPDAAAMHEIVERAYGTYVERIGRRPAPMDDDYAGKIRDGHVSVADEGGEIVGLIGRSLMSHADACTATRGIAELRLYTDAAMTENLALYPRLGYHDDDRRTEGRRRMI